MVLIQLEFALFLLQMLLLFLIMGADHGKQEDYNIILMSISSRIIHTVIFFIPFTAKSVGFKSGKIPQLI